MVSRVLGVAAVAGLLLTAGLASAQSFTLTLEEDDPPQTVSPGDSVSVGVTVILQGDEFSCLNDEELPVTVEAEGSQSLTASVDPAELVFSDTMGIHNSATPAGEYNESESTTVTIDVAPTAMSGQEDVAVNAEFAGGNYGPPDGSCSGEFPSTSGSTTVPLTVEADEPDGGDGGAGDGGDGSGGDGGDGDGGDEDENGLPVPAWIAPIALISTALALRARPE